MAETIDKPTIINRALARIGAAPLVSIESDDDETRQALAIYDDLIDAALDLWDWSWARRTHALDKLSAAPFGFAAAFRFPAEAVSAPIALYTRDDARSDPLRDFRVEGRTVAADAEALWGTFSCRIAPAEWPAGFRLAFTVWLAASLAVPITHDADLAARLMQEACGSPSENGRGGLIGRAVAADRSKSGGVAPLNASDAFTDSWHGGGRFGW